MGAPTNVPAGTRVKVSFPATVVGYHEPTSTIQVRHDSGLNSYVFQDYLEIIAPPKPPPYTDRVRYEDTDGEVFRYTAAGDDGEPGWWEQGTNVVHGYKYPTRPLRVYTEPIDE